MLEQQNDRLKIYKSALMLQSILPLYSTCNNARVLSHFMSKTPVFILSSRYSTRRMSLVARSRNASHAATWYHRRAQAHTQERTRKHVLGTLRHSSIRSSKSKSVRISHNMICYDITQYAPASRYPLIWCHGYAQQAGTPTASIPTTSTFVLIKFCQNACLKKNTTFFAKRHQSKFKEEDTLHPARCCCA